MVLSAMACKKDDNFPNYLVGTWPDVFFADDVIPAGSCQVRFTKVADDKLKMEVLTEKYEGDVYILNIDKNSSGMPIYTQTFENNGSVTVSGKGHATNNGFSIDMIRNNLIVIYSD